MKNLLVPFFILIAFFVSCKKNTSIVEFPNDCLPYSNPSIRIKETKVFEDNKMWKSVYYYDSLNRLRRRCDSGDYYNEVLWKYDTNKVYTLRADSTILFFYNLNFQKLAVSSSIGLYQWEYDSSGYLIRETITVSGLGIQIENYYYKCWNKDYGLSSGSDENGNPTGGGKTTYEYYTDKLNTIGDENMGMIFRGRQNNCLLKYKISRFQTIIDTIESNTYEFDSLNRVLIEVKKTQEKIRTTIFTYYD